MNHAVVDRAIEEYWRHAPIGRKFENQKYPILSKLKKWYSTARYQFYLGFFLYAIFLAFFTTRKTFGFFFFSFKTFFLKKNISFE